jgi:hypothetical protein
MFSLKNIFKFIACSVLITTRFIIIQLAHSLIVLSNLLRDAIYYIGFNE